MASRSALRRGLAVFAEAYGRAGAANGAQTWTGAKAQHQHRCVGRSRRVPEARRRELWAALEAARRNASIVQHHDAITGTFCAAAEGCPGFDQDVGSHNVLGSYERMLEDAIEVPHMPMSMCMHITMSSFSDPPMSTF